MRGGYTGSISAAHLRPGHSLPSRPGASFPSRPGSLPLVSMTRSFASPLCHARRVHGFNSRGTSLSRPLSPFSSRPLSPFSSRIAPLVSMAWSFASPLCHARRVHGFDSRGTSLSRPLLLALPSIGFAYFLLAFAVCTRDVFAFAVLFAFASAATLFAFAVRPAPAPSLFACALAALVGLCFAVLRLAFSLFVACLLFCCCAFLLDSPLVSLLGRLCDPGSNNRLRRDTQGGGHL